MVSLLVVTLLLVPCLADADGISLSPRVDPDNVSFGSRFPFLCMKQDGSYVPLANSKVVVRGNVGNGNEQDLYTFTTNELGEYGSTDMFFELSLSNVHLWLDIECATYRSKCPAVENMCQFSPKITLDIPYWYYKRYYGNDGAFALITPRNQKLGLRSDLPTKQMTAAQFCEPPQGYPDLLECHFKSLVKRSSNIYSDAATADFNKGRPARLAKGLF